MRTLLLAVCLLITSDAPRLSLYPQIVMAGKGIRVTCRITPTKDTRSVIYGIERFRTSGRQVDGEDGIQTYDFLVERMPCNVGPAFCIVGDSHGKRETTTLPFEIIGCEPQ